MRTSDAGARGARSLASAIGCGRRPRTAGFSPMPRRKFCPPISPVSRSTAPSGVSPIHRQLAFLDPPPRAALKEARALLTEIGAIDGDGRITDEGRAIASLALPPRLARMVVDAAREGEARTASEIAVVLTERGLGGDSVDLAIRLEAFRRDRSPRAEDARRLARGLAARAETLIRPSATFSPGEKGAPSSSDSLWGRAERSLLPRGEGGRRSRPDEGAASPSVGALLASAFPDRIAASRGKRGEFLMANGRAAALEAHDPLAGEPFLAIGEIAGRAASARILMAAALASRRHRKDRRQLDRDRG